MRQIVQNYRSGELALIEVPPPACGPGGVLVRTRFSLISTGTELMKVDEAGKSLLAKARARPDQVAKVVQSVTTNGAVATYQKVMSRLDSYTPLGYSLCGTVEEVGAGVEGLAVGDLVACAGNEHALHAELNWVPTALCTPVPRGVPAHHAAFATVGSIALQGVRRGEPQLGEVALVIGLGLVGQLVVQLLVAAGVRVIGTDPAPDRCLLAETLGATACDHPDSTGLAAAIAELTAGRGVDHVFLAAGGTGNGPVELAARASRDRGRVVDIGKCSLDLPWNAYYEKELDVRFSRSYGPGRYDPAYELEGRDYPAGYVRWTEGRNIECFLDLLAAGRVDVGPLASHTADFADAVGTYTALTEGSLKAVGVLFRYPATEDAPAPVASPAQPVAAVPAPARLAMPALRGPVRLGFVGAGAYASSMLLPRLTGREDVTLARVVTTSSLSAANARRTFGFEQAGTDLDALLDDPRIDAVVVVTRHSSHAALTCRALRAGKAVFVEKPLALTPEELDSVLTAVAESGNDRLQVGFNRRFAPLLVQGRAELGTRRGPAVLRYLVNAGGLDTGSWYLRPAEGSRFLGEGGHFVDTASWLLGSEPVSVFAGAMPQQAGLNLTIGYADGSSATITYSTTGPSGLPKESIDLIADGKALRLHDFVRTTVVQGRRSTTFPRIPRGRDKGQRAELDAFVSAVRTGGPMPIPLGSLVATSRTLFAAERSLAGGGLVRLGSEGVV